MVMTDLVKRIKPRIVDAGAAAHVAHVVGDNVDHEVHARRVQGLGQGDQVRRGAKVGVDAVDILGPVAVVGGAVGAVAFNVGHDGGYPDLHVSQKLSSHKSL